MKICLPVDRIEGLDSEIASNFRASPALLLVDSVSREHVGINAICIDADLVHLGFL